MVAYMLTWCLVLVLLHASVRGDKLSASKHSERYNEQLDDQPAVDSDGYSTTSGYSSKVNVENYGTTPGYGTAIGVEYYGSTPGYGSNLGMNGYDKRLENSVSISGNGYNRHSRYDPNIGDGYQRKQGHAAEMGYGQTHEYGLNMGKFHNNEGIDQDKSRYIRKERHIRDAAHHNEKRMKAYGENENFGFADSRGRYSQNEGYGFPDKQQYEHNKDTFGWGKGYDFNTGFDKSDFSQDFSFDAENNVHSRSPLATSSTGKSMKSMDYGHGMHRQKKHSSGPKAFKDEHSQGKGHHRGHKYQGPHGVKPNRHGQGSTPAYHKALVGFNAKYGEGTGYDHNVGYHHGESDSEFSDYNNDRYDFQSYPEVHPNGKSLYGDEEYTFSPYGMDFGDQYYGQYEQGNRRSPGSQFGRDQYEYSPKDDFSTIPKANAAMEEHASQPSDFGFENSNQNQGYTGRKTGHTVDKNLGKFDQNHGYDFGKIIGERSKDSNDGFLTQSQGYDFGKFRHGNGYTSENPGQRQGHNLRNIGHNQDYNTGNHDQRQLFNERNSAQHQGYGPENLGQSRDFISRNPIQGQRHDAGTIGHSQGYNTENFGQKPGYNARNTGQSMGHNTGNPSNDQRYNPRSLGQGQEYGNENIDQGRSFDTESLGNDQKFNTEKVGLTSDAHTSGQQSNNQRVVEDLNLKAEHLVQDKESSSRPVKAIGPSTGTRVEGAGLMLGPAAQDLTPEDIDVDKKHTWEDEEDLGFDAERLGPLEEFSTGYTTPSTSIEEGFERANIDDAPYMGKPVNYPGGEDVDIQSLPYHPLKDVPAQQGMSSYAEPSEDVMKALDALELRNNYGNDPADF